jgi:DNA-binding response OmpR family regulator
MDPKKTLKGKRVLVVDDEEDVLELVEELLDMCKLDTASSFEVAREFLENNYYHIVVLDIMGVRGYDLLEIASRRDIPALMLTAHALSEEDLKKSVQMGASFYAPKEEINRLDIFLTDVLEAREKKKNIWTKWFERMSGFCDKRFGRNWRDKDREFWDSVIKY